MQNIVAHKEMSILISRGERCKASSFELRVVKADDVHDFYFYFFTFFSIRSFNTSAFPVATASFYRLDVWG